MATYDAITTSEDLTAFPEDVASDIIGSMPETSAVMRLGRQLPTLSRAQRRVRVWDTLPFAYFVNGNTGLKQTTKIAWKNVYLNVEEIAVIVPIPENDLADSDTPIFDRAKPYIVQAIGAKFDRAVLFGEEAPDSWPKPLKIGALEANHWVGEGDVGDLFDDLLAPNGVLNKVEEDGFMVNGHLAAMSMKARLRGLRDNEDRPIFVQDLKAAQSYALDGETLVFPRNGSILPDDDVLLVSGDWDQLVWAPRQDITYKVLDQAVISDADGNIIYNLAQQDMVALRVVTRLAWALPNPTTPLNTDEDTRYPFALYSPEGGS